MTLTPAEARARVIASLGRQLTDAAASTAEAAPAASQPAAEPTLEPSGGVPTAPPAPQATP